MRRPGGSLTQTPGTRPGALTAVIGYHPVRETPDGVGHGRL